MTAGDIVYVNIGVDVNNLDSPRAAGYGISRAVEQSLASLAGAVRAAGGTIDWTKLTISTVNGSDAYLFPGNIHLHFEIPVGAAQ